LIPGFLFFTVSKNAIKKLLSGALSTILNPTILLVGGPAGEEREI